MGGGRVRSAGQGTSVSVSPRAMNLRSRFPVAVLPLLALPSLLSCGNGNGGPVVIGPGDEDPTLNLAIGAAFLVQATQRLDGGVPLVAGRDAWVRVFPVANEANTVRPAVRVRFYQDGVLFDSLRIPAPDPGVPDSVDPSSLDGSWSAPVPGDLIVEGLSIQAVVDVDATLPETDETDNWYPSSSASAPVEVTPVPIQRLRFVPIQTGAFTGGVPEGQVADYLALARRIFPLDSVETEVRTPFTSSQSQVDDGGFAVLNELRALRDSEGVGWVYVGVVDARSWPGGETGLASDLGTALLLRSTDAAGRGTWMAHHWGRLLGREHAPACDGGGDADYPYDGDVIGQVGFDVAAEAVVPADALDIMSACGLSDPWVSDYTWEAVLEELLARGDGSTVEGLVHAPARQPAGAPAQGLTALPSRQPPGAPVQRARTAPSSVR